MIWNEKCSGKRKDGCPCNANATYRGRDGVVFCYHHMNQSIDFIRPFKFIIPPEMEKEPTSDKVKFFTHHDIMNNRDLHQLWILRILKSGAILILLALCSSILSGPLPLIFQGYFLYYLTTHTFTIILLFIDPIEDSTLSGDIWNLGDKTHLFILSFILLIYYIT